MSATPDPLSAFWAERLDRVAKALRGNNFLVHVLPSLQHAREYVLASLIPEWRPSTVAWGGSMTFTDSGLFHALKNQADLTFLNPFDSRLSRDELMELRRQALLCDLFITGSNAVTMDGELINLDMIGNRVGAMLFGPRRVLLLVGRNKLVEDRTAGMHRVKDIAAPANAIRLDKKTPCRRTTVCQDCSSPERICNVWTVIEKCFPPERITVCLINEDCGL